MIILFKNSLLDFKITSFLFVPFLAFIFNRMLMAVDSGSILNSEVIRIVLSYSGLIVIS